MQVIDFDDYIPLPLWGKDHWSMLGYADHVISEQGGFQVGFDGRMRQNRRNFRVMHKECPKPKRTTNCSQGIPMDRDEYGSRLNNDTQVRNHDDWCCIQDMANEGFFTVQPEQIQPSLTLHLSEKGVKVANQLRDHKRNQGTFATFRPIGV